jgi:hypothetical protein
MRNGYFLIIAVLIYIMPALVFSIANAALSRAFLFYLIVFLPYSPFLFSLLSYPYGIIFGILYYAIGYGLLYRYWKMHVASVEGAEFRFGKWWSLFLGCVVLTVTLSARSFVPYGFYMWYIFMVPVVAFLSFGILLRHRIVNKYYFLSLVIFAIWYVFELIFALRSLGGAP